MVGLLGLLSAAGGVLWLLPEAREDEPVPRVVVLDYGSGNLRSAERALARVGADVTVTSDLALAAAADGLVVPGVGAYAACMAGIDDARRRAGDRRPGRGRPRRCSASASACRSCSTTATSTAWSPRGSGCCRAGSPGWRAERVPHMGWNTVDAPPESWLFAGLPAEARFYFVHSYAAHPGDLLDATGGCVTTTVHDGPFVAAVETGHLAATQFHPEKSGDAGAALLRNWLRTL